MRRRVEVICGSLLSEQNVLDAVKQAETLVDSVCLPSCRIAYVHKMFPNIKISTIIDQVGSMTALEKQNCSHLVYKYGASILDYQLNTSMILDKKYAYIINELGKITEFCQNNSIELRPVVDFHHLDNKSLLKVAEIIVSRDIKHVISSFGGSISDIITAVKIVSKKTPLQVIPTVRVTNQQEFNVLSQFNLFGVRFNSPVALKFCGVLHK